MAHECQLLNVLVQEACHRIGHLQLHSHEVVRRFNFVPRTCRGILVQRLGAAASWRATNDAILTVEQKPEVNSTSNPYRVFR
jgi:hypothetical protein